MSWIVGIVKEISICCMQPVTILQVQRASSMPVSHILIPTLLTSHALLDLELLETTISR